MLLGVATNHSLALLQIEDMGSTFAFGPVSQVLFCCREVSLPPLLAERDSPQAHRVYPGMTPVFPIREGLSQVCYFSLGYSPCYFTNCRCQQLLDVISGDPEGLAYLI